MSTSSIRLFGWEHPQFKVIDFAAADFTAGAVPGLLKAVAFIVIRSTLQLWK